MRDRHGRRNFLRILDNMPGRRDAGRIWQKCLDEFLRTYGLRQLISDRRVWVYVSSLGTLIYYDHVGESRLTLTAPGVRLHFCRAWALQFDESLAEMAITEDFTGLRHRPTPDGLIAVSCEGVIRRLGDMIAPWPLTRTQTCDSPMAETALRALRDSPPEADPIDITLLVPARKIVGCCGFITTAVRCDGYFPYAVLSRYVNPKRMTALVWRLILRLAHYLATNVGLHLHLAPPERVRSPDGSFGLDLFECFVDSSHANAESGLGYAGYILMSRNRRGGALGWRVVLPPMGFDSTAAAELHATTMAFKHTVAIRTLQSELELGVGPTVPAVLLTDAQCICS